MFVNGTISVRWLVLILAAVGGASALLWPNLTMPLIVVTAAVGSLGLLLGEGIRRDDS